MRTWVMVALLGLAGCTGLGAERTGIGAGASASPMPQRVPAAATDGAFAGEWEACEGTSAPEECGRYQLLQHGARICGTWSYFASGKSYVGRVIAQARSSTEARRTQICGRPGSETDTECEDGWQRIDKPLWLCDGKLGDLTRPDGTCFAHYRAVPMAASARHALQAEPWMQACLSGAGD